LFWIALDCAHENADTAHLLALATRADDRTNIGTSASASIQIVAQGIRQLLDLAGLPPARPLAARVYWLTLISGFATVLGITVVLAGLAAAR